VVSEVKINSFRRAAIICRLIKVEIIKAGVTTLFEFLKSLKEF
jgi:hypothetical protein